MIVLQTVLLGAGMALALYFFGFGVTRLVLPRALDGYARLLTLFFGMALVIVWDYIALWLGFNLTWATWGLVAVAVVMGVGVLIRERKRQTRAEIAAIENIALRQTTSRLAMTSSLWVIALALVAFCAAVAPLWRYGFVTVIGENWDYEFYLPLADYLREMTTAQLASAPPNPLLSTILSRHILPLPMGFSYLHATLNELLRMQALDTFPILMGVLHALGVVGAFLFFRAAFKMSERAALVATAFVAINGLLLWFTYWSFGLHLAALALLPVGLLLGVQALSNSDVVPEDVTDGTRMNADERGLNLNWLFRVFPRVSASKPVELSWRAWVSAGLVLGALNVTYHPALIVAGLSLGAFALWLLITERNRIGVVVNGAAVVALTIVFSFPTLGQIDDFVREYYGRTPLAIGLREFVPFADGYGFSNQTLEKVVGQTISTPQLFALAESIWEWSGTLLTLAAVGFSLFALWRLRRDTERRGVWYAMVAAAMIYVLVSRLPFLRPYPYGFLKSLSLVSYILIALTVQGIVFAWDGRRTTDGRPQKADRRRRIIRYGAVAALVLFGAISLFTFGITLEQYFKPSPMFFNADALRVRELEPLLASQTNGRASQPTVFLTNRAEVQGIPMGLVGYALRGEALYGNVSTGYGDLNNAAPNAVYDYALLARGEDPAARGYQSDAVWQNEKFALYPRERGLLVHQFIDQFHDSVSSFDLTLDVNGLPEKEGEVDHTPAERALTLGLVTFQPRQVTWQLGDETHEMVLERGLSVYTIPVVHLPTTLNVRIYGGEGIYIPFLQLREPNAVPQTLEHLDAAVVHCLGSDENLDVLCRVVNPQERKLIWKWVVRGTADGSREDRELIVAQAQASPSRRVRAHVSDSFAFQDLQFDDDAPIALPREKLPPGKWRADLEVWDGETLMARLPVHPYIQVWANSERAWRANRALPPVILAR